MGVDVQGHFDLLVAETALDDVRRDACREHQRGHRVAHAVELDPLHTSGLDELREFPRTDRVHLKASAERIGPLLEVGPFLREDESVAGIVQPVPQLDLGLMLLVDCE